MASQMLCTRGVRVLYRSGRHHGVKPLSSRTAAVGIQPFRRYVCTAKASATKESVRNIDITKIDTREGGALKQLQETVWSPSTLITGLIGVGGGFALYQNPEGAVLGAAVGAALRAAQLLFLTQTVPFTLRKHTLLLPVGIELTMGEATFRQQLAQYKGQGKLLGEGTSDYRLVQKIAERVIAAVNLNDGGGFQSHLSKFKWEVVVVDDKTPNAFVLPGGKIVVFTGLIKLMDQREDLLAAVIGHEVAHALARHSSEKLSLGLFITVAANLLLAALSFRQRQEQRQQGGRGRGSGALGGSWYDAGGRPGNSYRGRGGMMQRGGLGGGGSPLLNPQVLSIFTNLFLQMPFSRRAEAEADLIGMKLMALAGYDPHMAPETFRKLASAEMKMPGGGLGSLGCTHPRSDTRVQMLEEELALMREGGDAANHKVLHKVPYWML